MYYSQIYDKFLMLLDQKSETDVIDYLNSLSNIIYPVIALNVNKDGLNLIDLIIQSEKNNLLAIYIAKISSAVCQKLCIDTDKNKINTLSRMASNPVFRQFAEKLPYTMFDLFAESLRPYSTFDEICNLQVIAENQTPEVFSWFLSQLSFGTCQKLAPVFFKTIDVDYLEVESFQHYLKKIGFIVIDNYILSNTERSKKFIEHLASRREHQFFVALSEHLQQDAFNYILENFQLSPQALASLSFSKLLPALIRTKKNIGLKILSNAMEHPASLKLLRPQTTQLKSIQFYDGGESVDAWSSVSQALFSHAPKIKPHPNRTYLTDEIAKISETHTGKHINAHLFLRVQGRTILTQNKEGNIIAFKVKKKNEPRSELEKEFKSTFYLKQNADKLNLKSVIPTPLMVGNSTKILQYVKERTSESDFKQFAEMIDDQLEHMTYTYEINPKHCDYFTYLHDSRINDEIFKKANRDIVHDLYHLLQKGMVFPQLADIFHNQESNHNNRYDKGRYIILINLLNTAAYGGGRLTGWKKAVQYPNLRVSGIADVGDCISLHEMTVNSAYLDKYFQFVFRTFSAQSGNYLLANLIAEYQYVLFLIAGCRAAELTKIAKEQQKPEQEINAIWQTMAKQILDNCAHAASILTQRSEEKIQEFLSAKINVARFGRQMRYWMTTDYISDVSNNKIREDVYEKDTIITINHKIFRPGTFRANLGFSLNGIDPDLGAVNGQEPIKEANNLIYEMVNYIFISHHLLNETLIDLNKIIKEKDIKQSEELRKKSFSFLSEIAQEKIQFSLGKERLKQKTPLPDTIKSEIVTQQRNIAGNKIRRFWRTHQSIKRISTMRENRAVHKRI